MGAARGTCSRVAAVTQLFAITGGFRIQNQRFAGALDGGPAFRFDDAARIPAAHWIMTSVPPIPTPARLVSLDTFRGFVMFLMAAELLEVPEVARHFPDSPVWQFIAHHSEHVAWSGCSLHDLIQP